LRTTFLWICFALFAGSGAGFAAAPQITSRVPDFAAFEGEAIQIIIKAIDPDGDSIFYVLDRAPAGATLTDSIFNWTPLYYQVGIDSIFYSVKDYPSLNTVSDTFQVMILEVGAAGSFTDETGTLALGDIGITNALAWADYNNDSLTDVFVANAGSSGQLYRGTTGAFVLESGFPAASGASDAASAAWDDYNHDGRIDLYVVNSGLFAGGINRLYRNDTSGTFVDITSSSGTGNAELGKSCSWIDFDCDGDPDIYVVNYGKPNELYSNNGNGTFTTFADSAGVADAGDGTAAAWCDYNLDRKPDLYLVNENGTNRLFKNNGDSTFTDITATAGVGHTGNGTAAAWGDYDGDGDFDLFLANKDSVQVLFSNNGNGTFTRLLSTCGLAIRGKARSAVWLDYNLDGYLDLALTFSDSTSKLFQNLKDSTFINVAPLIGMDDYGYWTSVTWADPLNQGVPDLYFGRRDGANKYWHGRLQANYLKVRLHGVVSSRFGIGAQVKVHTRDKAQMRWIDGGSGSMSEPAALFGLDTVTTIDSLVVVWPSGLRRDTANLAVNKVITWFESDSVFPRIDSTLIFSDTTFLTGPYPIDTWVSDNNSLTVILGYSTNRGKSYSKLKMTDQGSSLFRGNIPGQASGTRVYYFVEAIDAIGHRTKNPYYAPDSFFSFSVDDSVPYIQSITLLPDTSSEQGPYPVGVKVFDDDSLRNVYLVRTVYQHGIVVGLDSAAMDLVSIDSVGADSGAFTFTSQISGQEIGTKIDYYARAVDLAGNFRLYPSTSPDSTYSFQISSFSQRNLTASRISRQGMGVAVSDYNLDGHPDVFLANLDSTDYLLRGEGDSLFTDLSSTVFGSTKRVTTAGYWGDYNNDRYPDLYIVTLGANVLLSNDRDGTFTDITGSAGVGDAGKSWSAAWVDYDRDGLLDLFVVNNDGTDRLYHNMGDSTFVDTALVAGLSGAAGGVDCSWADYDKDGDPDLYVVYYGASNRLYRNEGNGTFTNVTSQAGVAGGINSVSAVWYDYNNDFLLDLYLVEQQNDFLFRANSGGTFTQVDLGSLGLGLLPGGFSATWGDFDNDSYVDLLKTRGEIGREDLNIFYHGLADGKFDNITYESGIIHSGEYRGAAWLDYNADGRLDLIINNHAGKAMLYRNISPWLDNHYLRVKLLGTSSNSMAFGTRVTVFFGGKARMQQLGSGTCFTSQSEPVLHFGLGSSAAIDSMVVSWPSGTTQTVSGLAADRLVLVTEIDTLYPRIVHLDTIPEQYLTGIAARLTCRIMDGNNLTDVRVRYSISAQDTFTTAAMTRDSLSTNGQGVLSFWHFIMPLLESGSSNSWKVVATSSRGAADSTSLLVYKLSVDSLPPEISFISGPDSILPDTSGPYRFVVRLVEQAGLSKASFILQGQKRAGTAVTSRVDTTFTSQPRSLDWQVIVKNLTLPLGTVFSYRATAEDILGHRDSLLRTNIKVGPRPGKSSLSSRPVSVTDLLRLLYLVLESISTPTLLDTMGLDMDRNNEFDTEDLVILLDLWKKSSSGALLLAGAGDESGTVEAGLTEEGDGVAFYLKNQVTIPYGLVELEVEGSDPLRIVPGRRLEGLLHMEGRTRAGKLCLVFLPPDDELKGLTPGEGFLFQVPGSSLARLSVSRVCLGAGEVTLSESQIGASTLLPKALTLEQNVPNPFNPSTTIRFGLPDNAHGGLYQVRLDIYNLRGALVRNLLNEPLGPGYHSIYWEGTGRSGRTLPSGVYFYRLRTGNQSLTRKLILLK